MVDSKENDKFDLGVEGLSQIFKEVLTLNRCPLCMSTCMSFYLIFLGSFQ